MLIRINYGDRHLEAQLTQGKFLGSMQPTQLKALENLSQEITKSIRFPVDSEPLDKLTTKAGQVVIVISDPTRPLPSGDILPVVFQELEQRGVEKERITIVIGVGNHRAVKENEKRRLLGSLYGQVKCFDSKEKGYSLMGITKRGTPVEVAAPLADAGLVISLGNIELHQLAAYSGGVKAVAAGVASFRALEHNHRLSTLQEDATGVLEASQVRQDMEEFASIAGLRFIINVVLNQWHQVVQIVSGHPVTAHRIGCETARILYSRVINELADIVIASPGGTPKDDTVYQAQKSIKNALRAVSDRGIIILAARCGEGFGDPTFEKWINEASNPQDILDRSSREFVLGGHKSAFIAKAVEKAVIFLVSDLEPAQVKKLFFEPFSTLQEAIDAALKIKGDKAKVLLMPWAGLTVPYLPEHNSNIGLPKEIF